MKRNIIALAALFIILSAVAGLVLWNTARQASEATISKGVEIPLPEPQYDGGISVEKALLDRRSIRLYAGEPLEITTVSQLLWAAQGVTNIRGFRTAPSAGALYPLEIFILVGAVQGLDVGVYRYIPQGHRLVMRSTGDRRADLAQAALGQEAVKEGAAVLVIAAVYERTMIKYGDRGRQYVHMEVGSAAQNVYLQATSLGIGTVFIGAFYDDQVQAVLGLEDDVIPLGIMPLGSR